MLRRVSDFRSLQLLELLQRLADLGRPVRLEDWRPRTLRALLRLGPAPRDPPECVGLDALSWRQRRQLRRLLARAQRREVLTAACALLKPRQKQLYIQMREC